MARREGPLAGPGPQGVNPIAPADLRPATAYRLPEALRPELARPFGPVVQEAELEAALAGDGPVLLVGDVVSLACKRLGLKPKAFIVDYHTQRKAEEKEWRKELGTWGRMGLSVRNPAGAITREAWDAVRKALWLPESPVRIAVDGEEDLLGIPCFLEAPLGAKVAYGMPGQGVCVVAVTAQVKAQAADLVARMQSA